MLLALRFSKGTAAAREVEKWWTREECVPGAVVSGHGPTHFAADELGNHGNAHTDARNISYFAWDGFMIINRHFGVWWCS